MGMGPSIPTIRPAKQCENISRQGLSTRRVNLENQEWVMVRNWEMGTAVENRGSHGNGVGHPPREGGHGSRPPEVKENQSSNSLVFDFSRLLLELPVLVLRWPVHSLIQSAEAAKREPGKERRVADGGLT